MPDSGNTTFWGYFLTAIGTMSGAFMVTAKIKGAQDQKIQNVDDKISDVAGDLTEHKHEVQSSFDAQGERINSRVHQNDFDNLKETMSTGFGNLEKIMSMEFEHIREANKIIQNNTNRRRGSDKDLEDEV